MPVGVERPVFLEAGHESRWSKPATPLLSTDDDIEEDDDEALTEDEHPFEPDDEFDEEDFDDDFDEDFDDDFDDTDQADEVSHGGTSGAADDEEVDDDGR